MNNSSKTIANQTVFSLDLCLKEMHKSLIVKLRRQLFDSLNKKRSQKSPDFE